VKVSLISREKQSSAVIDFAVFRSEPAICKCRDCDADEIGEDVGPCEVTAQQEPAGQRETEGVDMRFGEESYEDLRVFPWHADEIRGITVALERTECGWKQKYLRWKGGLRVSWRRFPHQNCFSRNQKTKLRVKADIASFRMDFAMNARPSALAAACVLFTALCSVPVRAQAAATASQTTAAPMFDVATIKPSDPMQRNRGFHVGGSRVNIENQDVITLVTVAYSVHPKQILNAPDWLATARWEIDGVADKDGKLSVADVQVMLQKLLADRFGLKFKREQREIPVYALTVAKGGPKLEKSKSDPNALPNQNGNGKGRMQFQNTTMTTFLLGMQDEFDRPLVDQTGLDGHYDFTLRWTPDGVPTGDADAPPGMFTAIQEQLGLKIIPVKAPANVLVIEGAQKPTEN